MVSMEKQALEFSAFLLLSTGSCYKVQVNMDVIFGPLVSALCVLGLQAFRMLMNLNMDFFFFGQGRGGYPTLNL